MARAERSASRWRALSTLLLLAFGVGTAALILGLQYVIFGHPSVKMAVAVGIAAPLLFVGPARRFVRRRIAARRRAWIARAVREHGLQAAQLETLFPEPR